MVSSIGRLACFLALVTLCQHSLIGNEEERQRAEVEKELRQFAFIGLCVAEEVEVDGVKMTKLVPTEIFQKRKGVERDLKSKFYFGRSSFKGRQNGWHLLAFMSDGSSQFLTRSVAKDGTGVVFRYGGFGFTLADLRSLNEDANMD